MDWEWFIRDPRQWFIAFWFLLPAIIWIIAYIWVFHGDQIKQWWKKRRR